jgi:hypothetical protein
MARRTDFRKANSYTGQNIKNMCEISYKIDGVRLLSREGKIVTRNNKVPPGLNTFLTPEAKAKIHKYGDCEVYIHGKKFHEVSGPLNSNDPEPNVITEEHVYPLDIDEEHHYDRRLYIGHVLKPTKGCVEEVLKTALDLGYEGLVLRTSERWYRVKPDYTADVRITGWFEQKDKNKRPKGVLGGFTTNYGNVTAFSDALRIKLWSNPEQYVGKLMEVKYKELYENGSFRYAVTFLRFREDKDEEAFDTRTLI